MKHVLLAIASGLFLSICAIISLPFILNKNTSIAEEQKSEYWLLLMRKSNIEYLYKGVPGDITKSILIKTFRVKSGISKKKPTPLPQKLGYVYWIIESEEKVEGNPETEPYFLRLNVPVSDKAPFGPVPYDECDGQCNWKMPGYFGLHGVGKDPSRISSENEGSSGCIRHSNEDITYLYNLLDPKKNPVRYYIEDR